MVDTEILCFLEKVRLAPRFADTEILCFLEKVRSTPRFADIEILYFLKKVRSRQIPPYSNSALLHLPGDGEFCFIKNPPIISRFLGGIPLMVPGMVTKG